jgi:hypothetical protein
VDSEVVRGKLGLRHSAKNGLLGGD